MVKGIMQYKVEDEEAQRNLEVDKTLENYAYNMKNTVKDLKFTKKVRLNDNEKIKKIKKSSRGYDRVVKPKSVGEYL